MSPKYKDTDIFKVKGRIWIVMVCADNPGLQEVEAGGKRSGIQDQFRQKKKSKRMKNRHTNTDQDRDGVITLILDHKDL